MRHLPLIMLIAVSTLVPSVASADIRTKAIREAAELLIRRGGKEVAEETVETLASKMTGLAARHGDDVVAAAFRKVGPQAARVASEAGEHSGTALRLLGKHGDDALRLASRPKALQLAAKFGDDVADPLIRHGQIGEELVEKFGSEGAAALGRLSPQSGRRLAMLVQEHGEKVTPGLVSVFAKHGSADVIADFVWRNKGSLFIGGAMAAFLAAPEPFMNAAETVASKALDSAVQPVVAEAASQFPWGVVAIIGLGAGAALVFYKFGLSRLVMQLPGIAAARFSATHGGKTQNPAVKSQKGNSEL